MPIKMGRLVALRLLAALAVGAPEALAESFFLPDEAWLRRELGPAAGPTVRIEFVDVKEAVDLKGVHREMLNLGPVGQDGRRGAAHTFWKISWTIEGDPPARRVSTSYSAVIKLIRWMPEKGPEAESIIAWKKLLSLIAAHERRHLENAQSGAVELKNFLGTRLSGRLNISNDEIDSAAKDFLARVRRRDEEYDRQSDSGRKEGIVFP